MFESSSVMVADPPGVGEEWQLTDEQLAAQIVENSAVQYRAYARGLELTAEAAARDLASRLGYPNLPNLLQGIARISRREARQRVAHAAVLRGETGQAARDGIIGPEHISVISTTLTAIAPHVGIVQQREAESILVTAAATLDPAAVAKLGQEIVARLDQDGTAPSENDLTTPARELHTRTRRDGSMAFSGHLDAETGALLTAVLDPLAKPEAATETGPDLRDTAERYGDALAEVITLAAGHPELPTAAGERAHIAVTVPLEVLQTRRGIARLDDTGYLSATQARLIACDAKVLPVVLGSHSEPLDVGRLTYTVPHGMRRALTLRDQGCTFPGCARPARQCDAHHVTHWADGGDTALNNLVLLCSRHHRIIHRSHWKVRITHGHPEFTPPTWLTHHHHVRRNLLHWQLPNTG